MMSATDAQWFKAIFLTAQLPTRSEQISTLEVIATELEAVANPSMQAEALHVLVDACAANGELVRAHEPLGRLLQIYADDPYIIRFFGEPIVTIKRLAWRACRFPEVPRTQVLETIKHLEQWCAAEDAGMNSVYGAHLDWAVHRGDSLAAAEFYALQTAAPTTGHSSDDCLACLAGSWADYQAGLGQDEEAVRLFEAAFSQDQDCTEHLIG
jgi:tetratricopeptide (TPR) repeat protein